MMKKTIYSCALLVMMVLVLVGCRAKQESIEMILDWVPNTNHTGLYVALDKGYFKDAGLDVTIRRPPEGSSEELVGLGKAPFGIGFQDTLAKKFESDLPVSAVAAIIEHNTSGIISRSSEGIQSPKDLNNKSYGTWNDPIELAIMKQIMSDDGGDFDQLKLVPNAEDNAIVAIENNLFDAANIYYGWDGIRAEQEGLSMNFFYTREYEEALDFYSPVIIANNDYLKSHPEEAKSFLKAVQKGYQYAMSHPREAADILMKQAPELKGQEAFIYASQEWLSKHYAADPDKWGVIDEQRWQAFYQWLYDHHLTEKDLNQKQCVNLEWMAD